MSIEKPIAIKVKSVSKDFILPHEKNDSMKSTFVNIFRKGHKVELQHALRDISFDVEEGEFFGIVGRNGSGKSTLLKLIASIYQPSKGSISIKGRLVPFIELGVGFNPELTGRENTYLNGALMGFSTKEVDAKYEKIVEFAELEKFMDQKLKNYSSGMQVRLAFSVATILADSDILLIDEVLAVGDADFQRKCFNYFKKLKKQHKTVIFISHDMSAIREYCDRVAFINDSELVAVGKPDEITKLYDKLFIEEQSREINNDQKKENRWGSGDIKTSSINLKLSPSNITIQQEVTSDSNIDNPVVGFRVRDISGVEVFGTNTKVEKINLGHFNHSSRKLLTWKLPNILADGEYTIDPAVILADGTTADWWDDAVEFTIKKRPLPYNIDPGYILEIEEGMNEK